MTPATYTAILPIALLFIVFVLKLVIGRACNLLDVWRAAMEVPVDISIFGVSTLISFMILVGEGGSLSKLMFFLLLFFLLKVVAIAVWRKSMLVLDRGNLDGWDLLGITFGTILNFFFTILMAIFAVSLLVGKQNVG
ncbi:hypothetical protein [Pseudomonas sp. AIG]